MTTEAPAQPSAELPPSERPIVFFPGYTWDSEHSSGPFVAALEQAGHQVVAGAYYDQRQPDMGDLAYKPKDATDRLALIMLSQIKAAGLEHTPVNVVAHSYGALIYERAYELSTTLGWDCFAPDPGKERQAVLLAPSGTLEREKATRIIPRYIRNLGELGLEVGPTDKAFITQQKRLLGEPVRRLQEAYRLSTDRINYQALADGGVQVHIVGYGDDTVFPLAELSDATAKQPSVATSFLTDKEAAHSDLLTDPQASAGAVEAILRAAS